jgi:hypothetical protein
MDLEAALIQGLQLWALGLHKTFLELLLALVVLVVLLVYGDGLLGAIFLLLEQYGMCIFTKGK